MGIKQLPRDADLGATDLRSAIYRGLLNSISEVEDQICRSEPGPQILVDLGATAVDILLGFRLGAAVPSKTLLQRMLLGISASSAIFSRSIAENELLGELLEAYLSKETREGFLKTLAESSEESFDARHHLRRQAFRWNKADALPDLESLLLECCVVLQRREYVSACSLVGSILTHPALESTTSDSLERLFVSQAIHHLTNIASVVELPELHWEMTLLKVVMQ